MVLIRILLTNARNNVSNAFPSFSFSPLQFFVYHSFSLKVANSISRVVHFSFLYFILPPETWFRQTNPKCNKILLYVTMLYCVVPYNVTSNNRAPDLTEAFPFVISHSEVDQLFVAKGGSIMTTLSGSIHPNFLHIGFEVCMKTRGVLQCHTLQ